MGLELPKWWKQISLEDVVYFQEGPGLRKFQYRDSGIPFLNIRTISNDRVNKELCGHLDPEEVTSKYSHFLLDPGDIICSTSGTIGKTAIIQGKDIPLMLNTSIIRFRSRSSEIVKQSFILYFLKSNWFFEQAEEYSTGTAQKNLGPSHLKKFYFPLPPLPEQKRLVAKLDALFGHLDGLKTKLDRIPGLLKNFRQQVLTQAVTGKLTEEWREGKGLGEWELSTIGQLFDVKTGATPKRGTRGYYENATVPWIKSGLVKNELIFEADEFITEKAVKETNAKIFPVDTLLVAMYGEGKTRGQVGWMKLEAATNQAIAALVNLDMPETTRSYVFYFCLSQYNEIRAKAEGGNQPNLNLSKIKNWEISLPSYDEQIELIKEVNSLFELADSIESQYQSLKSKIDNLPQAILNKAFKGELVPQDSNDEPASELLRRIKVEREGKVYKKREQLSMAAEERGEYGK